MVFKGVHPPKDGKILARLQPISMVSLRASKSHSSKVPKCESFPHVTLSSHGSATHISPGHTKIASPHTPKLQTLALSMYNLALKLIG